MQDQKEDETDWQEIKLPNAIMPIGPEMSGTLYYLEMGKWTLFVHEPRVHEPPPEMDDGYYPGGGLVGCQPVVRWTVAFDDTEVASGAVGTAQTAKRVALTILEALEQGPPPEVPQASGYGVIRGRRGN